MKRTNDILIFAAIYGVCLCGVCIGGTITVGSNGDRYDFTSIQAAIDVAVDGDEIVVAPGTYTEAIDFLGKAVRLVSSDGSELTIIDGTGHYHVVQCVNGEGPDTVLEGFTITGGNANGTSGPGNSGGGMLNQQSSPTITHCIFTGNSATQGGGGMCNYFLSSPHVIGCVFIDNSSGYGDGGGMYNNRYSSPYVIGCVFIDNSSDFGGGGMQNTSYSSPVVVNTLFSGNSSVAGGGMNNFYYSHPTVVNCTFTQNSAGSYSPFYNNGGGMCNSSDSYPTITNSIFWNNDCWGLIQSGTCSQIYHLSFGPLSVSFSNVQDGYPGEGNIDINPLFVDADGENFRLQRGSPCINAGDNSAVPAEVTTDLNGWSRFIGDPCTGVTGSGTEPIVDMGAYEFLPADIDGSGRVDFGDFGFVAAQWQQFGDDCARADLNCDGVVDLEDMAILATWWLAGQ